MCPQILKYDDFLSCTIFTDEAKFHIYGYANQHNFIIWGSKPPREQEWDSPKVNMWYMLIYERVISPLFTYFPYFLKIKVGL
jgi:hypothetical protein